MSLWPRFGGTAPGFIVVSNWQTPRQLAGEAIDVYEIVCGCGNSSSAYSLQGAPDAREAAERRAWWCFDRDTKHGRCRACECALAARRRGAPAGAAGPRGLH